MVDPREGRRGIALLPLEEAACHPAFHQRGGSGVLAQKLLIGRQLRVFAQRGTRRIAQHKPRVGLQAGHRRVIPGAIEVLLLVPRLQALLGLPFAGIHGGEQIQMLVIPCQPHLAFLRRQHLGGAFDEGQPGFDDVVDGILPLRTQAMT
jgi:hypothetical protein